MKLNTILSTVLSTTYFNNGIMGKIQQNNHTVGLGKWLLVECI